MTVNKDKEKINMFIKPIFDKKYKHYLPSYIELKSLLKKIKKTSPSFDMMIEIYEFIKLLERVYLYGNSENHYLFSATVPKGYDASMIYKENNFEICYLLKKNGKEINIQTKGTTRNGINKNYISFHEGDNVINNKVDEQSFLFIVACLMNGLSELITYYYSNKKL